MEVCDNCDNEMWWQASYEVEDGEYTYWVDLYACQICGKERER